MTDSSSYSKFGYILDSSLEGNTGPPGVGFKLTPAGDYDINDKNLENVCDILVNAGCEINVDLINETTIGNGVVIDGTKAKDNDIHVESVHRVSTGLEHLRFGTNQTISLFNTHIGSDTRRPATYINDPQMSVSGIINTGAMPNVTFHQSQNPRPSMEITPLAQGDNRIIFNGYSDPVTPTQTNASLSGTQVYVIDNESDLLTFSSGDANTDFPVSFHDEVVIDGVNEVLTIGSFAEFDHAGNNNKLTIGQPINGNLNNVEINVASKRDLHFLLEANSDGVAVGDQPQFVMINDAQDKLYMECFEAGAGEFMIMRSDDTAAGDITWYTGGTHTAGSIGNVPTISGSVETLKMEGTTQKTHIKKIRTDAQSIFLGSDPTGYVDADKSVAIGHEALESIGATTSGCNVAIGCSALKDLTTASFNTAIGYQAGQSLTTTTGNTYLGYRCGADSTGADNIAVGRLAGVTVTGSNNISIGSLSNGDGTLSGNNNTSVGWGAGLALTSGANNTLLGPLAGDTLTTGIGNVIIGYRSGSSIITDSDKLVIETQAGSLIEGDFSSGITGFKGVGITFPSGIQSVMSRYEEIQFIPNVNGFTAQTTVRLTIKRIGNFVSCSFDDFTGTSNTSAMTTSLAFDATFRPVVFQTLYCQVEDNGTDVLGSVVVSTSGIVDWKVVSQATLQNTGFTNTGAKGVPIAFSMSWYAA